ncbi:MAG: hypothetical protein AB1492_05820 [Bacillota bacterium]
MRKWISLLTLLLLAAVFPASASATGTYYYYYEGLRDTRTSSTPTGYFIGNISADNNSPNTASISYKQTTTETRTSSLSGSVRFGAQVGNDALGVLNAQLGGSYTTSLTWTVGTTKGGTFTISPYHRGTIDAYIPQGVTQGTEVVRVEYYPAAGDPVFV